jgi:hypothetical protein
MRVQKDLNCVDTNTTSNLLVIDGNIDIYQPDNACDEAEGKESDDKDLIGGAARH